MKSDSAKLLKAKARIAKLEERIENLKFSFQDLWKSLEESEAELEQRNLTLSKVLSSLLEIFEQQGISFETEDGEKLRLIAEEGG